MGDGEVGGLRWLKAGIRCRNCFSVLMSPFWCAFWDFVGVLVRIKDDSLLMIGKI